MEVGQGTSVTFSCTFRDSTGALVDPDTVTLTLRAPDGTLTTPAVTPVSTGVYTAAATMPSAASAAGVWRWRWHGLGVGVDEGAWLVSANQVA